MKKHCILGFAMLWGQSSADFKFHSTNQWFWNFGKLRPLYLGVSNYVDIFFQLESAAEFEIHTTVRPQHHTCWNAAVFVHLLPSKVPKLPHLHDLLQDLRVSAKLHLHLRLQPRDEAGQAEHVLESSCISLGQLLIRDLAHQKENL